MDLRNKFKEIFEIIIFDICLFGFVVDGEQINGVVNDLNIGDDASTPGLTFTFGRDGQPYFVAMIAESGHRFFSFN